MVEQALITATGLGGNIVVVPVRDLDGTAAATELDTTDAPDLATALTAVNGLSAGLRGALRVATSTKAKVEFSIGFAMIDNGIVAMVNQDKGSGPIAVCLEWEDTPAAPTRGSGQPIQTGVLASTDRLIIRRFTAADAPAFAAYRSDPEVARYQSWTAPVSDEEAAARVAAFAAASEGVPGWFQYAVELRDAGMLIGDVGICLHDNGMQAELGFTLASKQQGKGYATEAVRCVLNRVFATGVHRVSAQSDARNTRSVQLLERLGFRREGHRIEHTWSNGEWTDDLLFGILARDWPTGQASQK